MIATDIRRRQDRLLLASHRLIVRSLRLEDQVGADATTDRAVATARQRHDYRRRQALISEDMAGLVALGRRGDAVLQ